MLLHLRRVIRRRPGITVLGIAIFVVATAGFGLRAYAQHQWNAAQLALREGRPAEARSRLRACLRIWPRNLDVHILAARAARLDSDFEGAETQLNRCLKLQNGATESIQLEFLLLRAQTGEVDEVAPALLKCVDENHPETTMILETLARHYMHHLEYKRAYACLCRWIEQTPDDAKPYHWRGWVQERLNNHKRGMEDYQKALQLDAELTQVRLRVAEMLLEDKQPIEALVHLNRLHAQFPDRPDINARLGQCYFLQGNHDEARRLLEAAVKEIPNDQPLLLHLGKLEVQQGRPVEAERWLRRLLELDPTDTEAHYTLVSALQLQGRTQEAEASLKLCEENTALLERLNRLLKEEAESPTGQAAGPSEIGTLLLRIGREQLALHWLFEALQRDPAHQPTHRVLAEHFESKGEKDKAAAHRHWLRESDANSQRTTKKQTEKLTR